MATHLKYPDCAEQQLSVGEAYSAMIDFLEAFWVRDGKPDDSLLRLLSFTNREVWADGTPADPAMWGDWLDAIQRQSKPPA
jgi:hypothetical protein